MSESIQQSLGKKDFTENMLSFITLKMLSAITMESNMIMMMHWSKKLSWRYFFPGLLHYNINSTVFLKDFQGGALGAVVFLIRELKTNC